MSTLGDESDPDAFARSRARVYGLFAAVFDGDVETLREAIDDDAFARLAETLPGEVDLGPLDGTFDHEALAFAYDNLFVVPGEHYVPPFASAHATTPSKSFESPSAYHDAGTAGELLGDSAARLSQLYARTGFEPGRGDGVPDHLAAIFEFQQALCTHEAALDDDTAALDGLLSLQRSVFGELAWLDAFDTAVQKRDSAVGVFATLSRLARIFVAWDARESPAAVSDSETPASPDHTAEPSDEHDHPTKTTNDS
ncbi:chaperone TorD involved in molybdoenzyme TorA maturation [Halogranum amylolyticum]|uniref:Chaperone TorD involved in molybdoenzyme TorA maturation n=1 Tax=Halogranum amylolyticum TaxID=660520 RepID=A0A1H8URC4_9EURY|nr:molecular chaperone TorD family protein [Halogranum amylolyticum]SEP05729.1 chaperone TorD involved in molybdoenzyme TorA maturation [Halogranum amylolyticum]